MNTAECQQIHLVPDVPPAGQGAPVPRAEVLPVPTGASAVVAAPGGHPGLVPATTPPGTGALIVEQISNRRRQLRLLVVNPTGDRLRVNGHVAPRVAILGEKDMVQLADDSALHVTLFIRPRIGSPPSELLGKTCPVCRTAFTESSTVYLCPCGTAMHCEPEDTDGLQCARMHHACIACERPITLKEGFSYWPDLIHE